ncbi:hypothetical protein B0T19DRAFT_34777 [Cercophora scortea]|uniref:F-box domain-containing protein n=1 Tax=Cercophora scortea TaxID=314031 RepID=A0AAE0MLN0_9PEZI|nr:hypothetical protein B0T19DRAFT_34777 [Cercophora scortea]
MHPPSEQDFITRTQMASTRIHQVTDAYSGLRHSHMGPGPAIKNVPMAYESSALERPETYNRPRRLSNSSASSSTSSVFSGPGSVEGRLRSISLSSSLTSIESLPPHGPTSKPRQGSWSQYQLQNGNTWQHHAWQKPAPIKFRRKAKPGELFAALPGEVLELILEELRKLHLQLGGKSCATCWMRDCCSVAVSARKFLKYAREALYQHVQIVGAEGPLMKKRTKLNNGSRLVLLRRTLRANPHIAVIVRSLKPPSLPPNATAEGYNDLIASVVMACPNLERLVGFYPVYDHSFQRLFHALSTRQRLKEMDWILAPSSSQQQQRMPRSGGSHKYVPGDLQPQDYRAFLDYHLNWQQLSTLVVHCHPGATLSPGTLLERTLHGLPSLQTLYLSHLPHTSFNDASLLALPPLKKLTLAFIPGVTTAGLSAMATRSASTSITSLTLIHINVESLPALARIFSNLTSLETFNLVQAYAPVMPTDEHIWLFPYLASQSLRKLHWDIPYLPTRATTADNILAKSISAHGFPELRTLRAPNDPEGVFQSLCRPVERVDNPMDKYRGQANYHSSLHGHGRSSSAFSRASSVTSSSRSGSISKINGPPSPLFPSDDLMMPRDNSNLTLARLAAQQRLDSARRFPRYFVNVIDEYGTVVEKYGVGAFIGTVESKINYKLTPDEGGTDEGGGLVGMADMLGDCGESLVVGGQGGKDGMSSAKRDKKEKKGEALDAEVQAREGCIGRWNTFSGAVVDKKDKERWWHAERGRWRGVTLS